MVRPTGIELVSSAPQAATGIELVSSAPQADTLSIELWALKSDWLRVTYYIIILTFLVLHFN